MLPLSLTPRRAGLSVRRIGLPSVLKPIAGTQAITAGTDSKRPPAVPEQDNRCLRLVKPTVQPGALYLQAVGPAIWRADC